MTPENKSVHGMGTPSATANKLIAMPSERKIMATVLQDHTGASLVCFLDYGNTVMKAECCCGTFESIQQAIRHKRPGLLCKASPFCMTSSNPTLPTGLVTCNSTATGRGCYGPHCLIPLSNNLQQTVMSSKLAPPGY